VRENPKFPVPQSPNGRLTMKPDWAERIQRGRIKAENRGAEKEKQRIVDDLLKDAFITTQLTTLQLENVIRVVDNG